MSPPRYPFFGEPPTRRPRPVVDEPALRGKRVILSTPEGFVYDVRAASEVYLRGDGRKIVDVVSEEAWFRWMFTKQLPDRKEYPIELVWVE